MEICVFSKHLQELDADGLGKALKGLGVDGADLTVRPGGHVEPDKVKDDLPRFRDTLARHGIAVTMISTGITAANRVNTEIIETAGKLGIKYLKLGYWVYKGFGHYRQQEKEVKAVLKDLEPVLKASKVKAGLHTHSGTFMGLNANYVWRLIEDRDPEVYGVYYDTGHETLEGGAGGWAMDLDLVQDRIFMVAVKCMNWFRLGNPDDKARGWTWRTVPLETGMADIGAMLGILKAMGYDGVYSLHSEYQGPASWRSLKTGEVIEQTRKDLAYFRKLLG